MKYLTIFFILFTTVLAFGKTKEQIINDITNEATRQGFDPDLAVAIATVESGLNPNAIGLLKERGLFQLRPEYHKLNGETKNNIETGIKYLAQLKSKFEAKHGAGWFVLYNYGPYNAPKKPMNTAYFKKVTREINRIKVSRYLARN